jgi:hypothetical protein
MTPAGCADAIRPLPCRPVAGSCVNFQVTLSRESAAGPERVRLAVRASSSGPQSGQDTGSMRTSANPLPETDGELGAEEKSPSLPEFRLDAALVSGDPVGSAARVLTRCLAG